MGKNISFLFLCFCLLICGNISKGVSEEINNCESYSNEYDSYIAATINSTNYSNIINNINAYISKFEQNNCSNKLVEARCKLVDISFLSNNLSLICTEDNINDCNNLINNIDVIIKDSESDYNKYYCDTLSKLKGYKNNYGKTICDFHSNKYEAFHNEDYANFINLINPDSIKPEGSTQLICRIEGNSYTPNTCSDIFNKINEYETKFKENNCSYKPSKLMCDKLEFDFITKFTNFNCTTLSTNNDEQMKECYELLNKIYTEYLPEYKNNNCITDRLEKVKSRVCDFYNNKYTNYSNTITNCDKNNNTNCSNVISEIEKYKNYFETYNCPTNLQNAKCELIKFNFINQTLNLSCSEIKSTEELNTCSNLVNNIDTYLTDMKNGKCNITDTELESKRNQYKQMICNYHGEQYNKYITDNSSKCNLENDISECQNIINNINSTYLNSFTSNKCTNELSKLQCNLLEFSFNKDSSNYTCNINDTSTEDDIIKCQNSIKYIDNYLTKYKNNKCNADNLNKYKTNYNKAICNYYNTQYKNYLQTIVDNGLQCNEDNKTDCTAIINGIKKYSNIFKSNNCPTELSESQCKLAEYNFTNNSTSYSCILENNQITNKQDAENCSNSIIQLNRFLSNIDNSCGIKNQLEINKNMYSTAICNFYNNEYNNYLNGKICTKEDNKDCLSIVNEIYNLSTDTGYQKSFETNNCTNELLKAKCDIANFKFINNSFGLPYKPNSEYIIENESDAEQYSNLLTFLDTYLLETKDINCNEKNELETTANNCRKAVCDFYSKKYTEFYDGKYTSYLEDLISGKLVCEKDANGKYQKDECLIIPNEIKEDINSYILAFNKNKCSTTLSNKSSCDLLELEFVMESSNAYCRTISTNDDIQMAKCNNFIKQIDKTYLPKYNSKNCPIDNLLIAKNYICDSYTNDYTNYLNKVNTENNLICKSGDKKDCDTIISEIEKYIPVFTKNKCTNQLSEAKCKKLEFEFINASYNYSCKINSETGLVEINNQQDLESCTNFAIEMDKYLKNLEQNNCPVDEQLKNNVNSYKTANCTYYNNYYDTYLSQITTYNEIITNINIIKDINSSNKLWCVKIFDNPDCETECEKCNQKDSNGKCQVIYVKGYNKDCKNIINETKSYISYFQKNNCSQIEKLNLAKCKQIEFDFNNKFYDYSCPRNVDDGKIKTKNNAETCSNLVNNMKSYLTKYDNLYQKEKINCNEKTQMQNYKDEYNTAICKFYDEEYQNYLAKVNPPIETESPSGVKCKTATDLTNGPFNCNKECSADCQTVITNIKTYITPFNDNNCSKYIFSNPQCQSIEFAFIEEMSKSTCKDATIDNFKNISKCRQFTEASYKKYLPQYEKYNCSNEYKCSLFLNEFNILVNNYYSLCKQGTNVSTDGISKNVLGNCSEAVFDLEQFYLKVKNYSCEYKAVVNTGNTPTDKDIASETLEIIKQYNKNIDDLINTGTGGIKSNGIARGLCYAINIITGPFGKAVASLFIILLGMSFLSGHSESMSFKSLISVAFALALIFGAEQLANIISKNVYSCKYIILDK